MFSKKLLLLYIVLLSLAICTMVLLAYYKSTYIPVRDYPQIRHEGVLRIVTDYNQSNYYLSDDKIEGFQYELSKAIAELSGLEILIYLEMSLEKSFEGLSHNQYDVIARNIPTTSDLKQDYSFAAPIVLNKQVLVQRNTKENNGITLIRNHIDLAKKTLYISQNSPVRLRLQNLQQEIGDTIFIVEDPLYSSEQLMIMVAKGDIDYAVCDLQIARIQQKQLPEIDIQTDISFTQLQSWAIRKNAPILLDSLNHWFNLIKDNGTFDKIYQEYYQSK